MAPDYVAVEPVLSWWRERRGCRGKYSAWFDVVPTSVCPLLLSGHLPKGTLQYYYRQTGQRAAEVSS